jgi:hypothetical protein
MLRCVWLAGTVQRSRRRAKASAQGRPVAIAATILGLALTTAVSAESLAQPRETALERRAADYIRFREDVTAIEATPFDSA